MPIKFNQSSCKIGGILILLSILYSCKNNINGRNPTNGSESTVFGKKNLIQIFSDIITPSDPTTFQKISYRGQGSRRIFDRRIGDRVNVIAYLFKANFDDGFTAEVIVNPEFGNPDSALSEAKKYSIEIGRLPKILRKNVETIVINRGDYPFGGSNTNLLIYAERGERKLNTGNMGSTLIHEAAHASLDPFYRNSQEWINAQIADATFLNYYAREHPRREDMAVSFIAYIAVRYRSYRFSHSLINKVEQAIPNRIEFFDSLVTQYNMNPLERPS